MRSPPITPSRRSCWSSAPRIAMLFKLGYFRLYPLRLLCRLHFLFGLQKFLCVCVPDESSSRLLHVYFQYLNQCHRADGGSEQSWLDKSGRMCFAQASSFTSEATLDGTFTIEALTEASRTSRTEGSNTNTQKSEASSGEPLVDYKASVKRSSELLKSPAWPQRKRRNASDSDYDLSQQSGLQSSESSGQTLTAT